MRFTFIRVCGMMDSMNETIHKKTKKIHLLPNVITALGLSCGLFVIFKMTMMEVGKVGYHELLPIVFILILAALADLLDGAIARVLKAESDFGGMFDSLADAISFGVAPSVIILKTLSVDPGTQLSFLLTSGAMIFSLCGVLRLVRFNVTSMRAKGDAELTLANKKNFTGVPIPIAAACAVSLNLYLAAEGFFAEVTNTWILTVGLALLGYLMVSRLKFPSIKALEFRVASLPVDCVDGADGAGSLLRHSAPFSFSFLSFLVGISVGWRKPIYRACHRRKTIQDARRLRAR